MGKTCWSKKSIFTFSDSFSARACGIGLESLLIRSDMMYWLQGASKDKVMKALETARPNLPAKPVKAKAAASRPSTAPTDAPSAPLDSDVSPDDPSEAESTASSAPSGGNKPVAVRGRGKAAAKKVRSNGAATVFCRRNWACPLGRSRSQQSFTFAATLVFAVLCK